MKIGLFCMVGDLLHAGHLLALKEAKENCDFLIVALNIIPDGKDPVESPYERFVRVKSCKYVDEVIIYGGEKDLIKLLKTTKYNIRFTGSDYTSKWTGCEYEKEKKIEHYVINREHGLSSSELKERIYKGEIDNGCSK